MSNVQAFIFMTGCFLFAVRGVRVYLRTGLKGELIQTMGLIIIIISIPIGGYALPIIGFILFNIGYVVVATFERNIRREIRKQTTFLDRLVGDVPRILAATDIQSLQDKVTGITAGVICIIIAFYFFSRVKIAAIMDIVYVGLLGGAGVFLILFSLFRKR